MYSLSAEILLWVSSYALQSDVSCSHTYPMGWDGISCSATCGQWLQSRAGKQVPATGLPDHLCEIHKCPWSESLGRRGWRRHELANLGRGVRQNCWAAPWARFFHLCEAQPPVWGVFLFCFSDSHFRI